MKVLKLNPIYVGISCALISYLAYALSDSLKKHLVADYSVIDIQFWNSLFSILCVLVWGLHKGELKRIVTTTQPRLHLVRMLLSLPIMFGITYVLRYMPLVNFYAIVFTTPFITAILAHFFFHERLNAKLVGIICLGFSGVLIAYPPRIESITVPLIMTLGIAFCIACLVLSFKVAAKGEHKLTYTLYPNIGAFITAFILSTDQLFDFRPISYVFMIGVGILVVLGLLYSVKAYQAAPAAVVSVVHYSQILYGTILGYLMFGDIPTINVIAGVFVILVAGLALTYYEGRKKPV